jgi:hypothetical protein
MLRVSSHHAAQKLAKETTDPHRAAEGVLLDSSAVIRFPPRVGESFADILSSGAPLAAKGYGASGPAGTAIEAVALGASESSGGPRRR